MTSIGHANNSILKTRSVFVVIGVVLSLALGAHTRALAQEEPIPDPRGEYEPPSTGWWEKVQDWAEDKPIGRVPPFKREPEPQLGRIPPDIDLSGPRDPEKPPASDGQISGSNQDGNFGGQTGEDLRGQAGDDNLASNPPLEDVDSGEDATARDGAPLILDPDNPGWSEPAPTAETAAEMSNRWNQCANALRKANRICYMDTYGGVDGPEQNRRKAKCQETAFQTNICGTCGDLIPSVPHATYRERCGYTGPWISRTEKPPPELADPAPTDVAMSEGQVETPESGTREKHGAPGIYGVFADGVPDDATTTPVNSLRGEAGGLLSRFYSTNAELIDELGTTADQSGVGKRFPDARKVVTTLGYAQLIFGDQGRIKVQEILSKRYTSQQDSDNFALLMIGIKPKLNKINIRKALGIIDIGLGPGAKIKFSKNRLEAAYKILQNKSAKELIERLGRKGKSPTDNYTEWVHEAYANTR